ncbi:MAG: thioredoxin domain-containing protein [Myxococcota bacterium]
MNRINLCTATVLIAASGCVPDRSDELDALTQRVEALEKSTRRATPPRPRRPAPDQTYFLPVGPEDPFRGAPTAKVTIVEAYEFACPYCALIEPMLAQVIDAYRGTDTVKIVSKQFVVHPNLAMAPALATCAAHKQSKFPEYAEALWKASWNISDGRPRMVREELGQQELLALAKSVGLDVQRFEADRDSQACKKKLRDDRAMLTRIGVTGTPYLFINGKLYTGARSTEALKAAVESEVKRVDAELAKGTQLAEYYDSLMKTARRRL